MNRRDALTAHLEFFQELGAEGFSREPAWRFRGERLAHPASPSEPTNVDSEASSTNDETTPTTLDQIREALGDCTRCKLHQGRTTLVFGVGHPDADLMFVG
ncbi:MAG: hypothetical protein ABGY72_14530, partial [bacterium]